MKYMMATWRHGDMKYMSDMKYMMATWRHEIHDGDMAT
jgi:hypothetical protein